MDVLKTDPRLTAIKELIASFPDFPKEGILFRDIFPVLRNPKALRDLIDLICERIKLLTPIPEVIVGLESRGFLFGPMVAEKLNIAFVPVRKAGKLPGKTVSVEYSLEYGKDKFEIQSDSIKRGQHVVILDDLLATGGTISAAIKLLEKLEAQVDASIVFIELTDLNGRSKFSTPVISLLEF